MQLPSMRRSECQTHVKLGLACVRVAAHAWALLRRAELPRLCSQAIHRPLRGESCTAVCHGELRKRHRRASTAAELPRAGRRLHPPHSKDHQECVHQRCAEHHVNSPLHEAQGSRMGGRSRHASSLSAAGAAVLPQRPVRRSLRIASETANTSVCARNLDSPARCKTFVGDVAESYSIRRRGAEGGVMGSGGRLTAGTEVALASQARTQPKADQTSTVVPGMTACMSSCSK